MPSTHPAAEHLARSPILRNMAIGKPDYKAKTEMDDFCRRVEAKDPRARGLTSWRLRLPEAPDHFLLGHDAHRHIGIFDDDGHVHNLHGLFCHKPSFLSGGLLHNYANTYVSAKGLGIFSVTFHAERPEFSQMTGPFYNPNVKGASLLALSQADTIAILQASNPEYHEAVPFWYSNGHHPLGDGMALYPVYKNLGKVYQRGEHRVQPSLFYGPVPSEGVEFDFDNLPPGFTKIDLSKAKVPHSMLGYVFIDTPSGTVEFYDGQFGSIRSFKPSSDHPGLVEQAKIIEKERQDAAQDHWNSFDPLRPELY